MNNLGIPVKEHTALLVIDVQDRLMPVIHEKEKIFENVNKLIRGAEVLDLEIIITEQYPKGLGHTCAEIQLPAENPVIIEKVCFSTMLSEPVNEQLKLTNVKTLIICGVESHICVLKTTLDALAQGYQVHVVADAVSSRTAENKQLALERMRQAGAFITSVEMILFMLMDKAGTDEFKAISKLIK
jgi:nicotinamidase-related amidase